MSGYREAPDRWALALELVREAHDREAQAMVAKGQAEIELRMAEANREIWWQQLGARSNLVRHLVAVQSSLAAARTAVGRTAPSGEPGRAAAELERIEAERASFLRERGVEPGPALTGARSSFDATYLEVALTHARGEIVAIEEKIREADQQIADARVAVEHAIDALAKATRARIEAQAEAKGLTG